MINCLHRKTLVTGQTVSLNVSESTLVNASLSTLVFVITHSRCALCNIVRIERYVYTDVPLCTGSHRDLFNDQSTWTPTSRRYWQPLYVCHHGSRGVSASLPSIKRFSHYHECDWERKSDTLSEPNGTVLRIKECFRLRVCLRFFVRRRFVYSKSKLKAKKFLWCYHPALCVSVQ